MELLNTYASGQRHHLYLRFRNIEFDLNNIKERERGLYSRTSRTLRTSAPKSANMHAPNGPGPIPSNSNTLTPVNGYDGILSFLLKTQ